MTTLAASSAAPTYDRWLRTVALPGTDGAKIDAAAARLGALQTFQRADIAAALEPLGLSDAQLTETVIKFRDAFEEKMRPDPGANFFDPGQQQKQAAWHKDIKRIVTDPISGQALIPEPGPIFLPAEELKGLLELGPLYHDGNAVEVNPTAKKLAVELEAKAAQALAAPSFEERNRISSEVIAMESAVLAATAAGIKDPAKLDGLYKLFFAAAYEAGAAFKPAFNDDGTKSTAENANTRRTEAQSAAGGIAYRHLPKLIELLGVSGTEAPEALSKRVVTTAAIEDVAAIGSADLKLNYYPSAERIAETLRAIVSPDDYFFSEIDRLQNHSADRVVLNLAVRLANTTWKAGQVHRAAWEGTDRRINPRAGDRLGVFNPYDNLKADMYNATFVDELRRGETEGLSRQAALARAGERAFARVVFEIYKDLVELKKAAAA